MFPPGVLPESLSLQPHETARDKTVSTCDIPAGTVILSVRPLATMLLPKEKGRRCDFCHSLAPQDRGRLQRCSGCASYWYCDPKCQSLHWRTHKKYCRNINAFCASGSFDRLGSHEKMDALLLTHLLAAFSAGRTEDNPDWSTFMSLLPGPVTGGGTPPICPLSNSPHVMDTTSEVFWRCGNNNFSIHSHLTTIAHGVFPLASRLFNHSCLPNAVAKYTIAVAKEVVMDIVAIRDIAQGEEICIPYVDPALVETRQHMFQLTYGFTCTCPSCAFFGLRDAASPVPESNELEALGKSLRAFVFPDTHPDALRLPSALLDLETVPLDVLRIFRESCLTSLCEAFSTFSHDGPFASALEVGLMILSFYAVIYPPNYPQIGVLMSCYAFLYEVTVEPGIHLLEMAKTAWNAFVSMDGMGMAEGLRLLAQARAYLGLSSQVWMVIGPEGDEGGPLVEIRVLERLLSEQACC